MLNHVMVGANDLERSKRFYDAVHHRLQMRFAGTGESLHDTALAHGGTPIEDPPGLRDGSLGKMYLAYVRDPDGHTLCAIYRPR